MTNIEELNNLLKEHTLAFELKITSNGKYWHGEIEYITKYMEEEETETFYNYKTYNELIEEMLIMLR